MIREATIYDKPEILEMLAMFQQESQIEELQHIGEIDDLLNVIFAGMGVIFIREQVGIILGIIVPSIWDKKTLVLHELAWYVKPEFRHTLSGYRLFKAFVDFGMKAKEEGRIAMCTMSKLPTSPNLDYGKYGFRKLDENWVM